MKTRLKNKAFWVSVIALIGLIIQFICKNYGVEFDIAGLNEILTAVLTAAVALGVVIDPTTPGVADSEVTKAKKSIDETAKDVVMRNLTNEDYAEILSKVDSKEKK